VADISKEESTLTELELRNQVVKTAQKYIGCKESDGSHKPIIDLYNSHTPRARGYKLQYADAWCAGFASAVAIACGLTDIIPTEVGCDKQIDLFKKIGRWQEKDSYVPKPGDYAYYDWQDNGSGDNTGSSDHVGIVETCDGKNITVIEGNYSNAVKRRTIKVDGRYIRGFGVPDYDSKPDEVKQEVKEELPKVEAAPAKTQEATTYYSVRLPLLKKGSEGAAVKAMQQLLLAKGYKLPKYGDDSDFGAETEDALKAYQKKNNLEVDGKCGGKTWAALITT
jgi:hypothetical protein